MTVTVGATDGSDHRGFHAEDDGPGIPEQLREAVFESGVSGEDGGTGFGLAIVDQLAALHEWDVTVTDGAEGGARFEFSGVTVTDDPQRLGGE